MPGRIGSVEELRALSQDFEEPARAFLEYVCTDYRHVADAYAPCLDSWHSEHGHVVLVGDAAHAILLFGRVGRLMSNVDFAGRA